MDAMSSVYKKMCLSCIPWGKGLENSFRLILSEKNFLLITTAFLSWRQNVAAWRDNIGKHIKFVTFFVYKIGEITAIFSNLESGALPILTQTYYVFPLWRATKEQQRRKKRESLGSRLKKAQSLKDLPRHHFDVIAQGRDYNKALSLVYFH